MSGFSSTLSDLESLFIEKLQEKYKLNKKDLKKAFSKFDTDGNGLLDLHELTKGVQLFLNGVKESQIRQLVSKYDKNGDGKISYDEFLYFLTSRTAISEDDDYSERSSRPSSAGFGVGGRLARQARQAEPEGGYYEEDLDGMADDYDASELNYGQGNQPIAAYPSRGKPMRGGDGYSDRGSSRGSAREEVCSVASSTPTMSEAPSALNPSNVRDLEYRAKIFLDNIKGYLTKQAASMRMAGKLSRTTAMMPAAQMHESVARELLIKAFQPYTGQGDGKSREMMSGVEMPEFSKVLRSFKFPGAPPLRTEVVGFLFDMCSTSPADGDSYVNEEGRVVADPNILTDLLFGAPTSTRDIKARGLNKVGRTVAPSNAEDPEGRTLKGYVARLQSGRDLVGSGPVQLPSATDAQQQRALDSLSVPLRFVSPKSRTVLAVPSGFDPVAGIARSNQLPDYDLVRKHVFGMSGSIYSGNTLYALPSTPSAFQSGVHAPSSGRNNPDFIDPASVVYATAGLGIVHNLAENRQLYFDAHNDDITCITVSSDGVYAATGQMGKSPMVHIWATDRAPGRSAEPVNTISNGFFSRGVCGLAFSWDNRYLVAIGCDDNHALGIFDTSTCALVKEMPCQHGIPPQIKWMEYCAGQQHTQFVTREHAGLCDMFATAGEHHLKIWSYRRPSKEASASLNYKACSVGVGKSSVSAPKAYLCCGFVYCEDKTYDLVAGGSNGALYLFRAGAVATTAQVFRSKVRCLVVSGDRVYCGGGGGVLKVVDARTLSTLQQFTLLPPDPTAGAGLKAGAGRPGSRGGAVASAGNVGAGGAARPRPASAGPASRLAHRTQPIKSRVALSAPKHAAGQNPRATDDSARHAISGAGMREVVLAEAEAAQEMDEGAGSRVVTGIAVVRGTGRVAAQSTYLIAALGTGKLVRVDVGSALGGAPGSGLTPRPGSAGAGAAASAVVGRDLVHFHTGPVYGLAADVSQNNRLFATVCDDRKLQVWDAQDCVLIAKCALQSPARCCHMDRSSSFIAVGATTGALTVYYLSDRLLARSQYYKLSEVAFRKDAKAEVTEVKFSPSNERVVIGCRDDCIYLYSCELGTVSTGEGRAAVQHGTCVLKAMHKLRGHSSTITHIDWSYDSALIRSTCAAYELLCWEVEAGKLNTAVNVADVKWKTHHCVLGFGVMGIWPPYADGTDINAIDVVPHRGLVATANDTGGFVRLHNYPCVVRSAPGKEYNGHSSHVMGLRFMRDGGLLMTVGGNDRSVVVWEVRRDESRNDPDGFRR